MKELQDALLTLSSYMCADVSVQGKTKCSIKTEINTGLITDQQTYCMPLTYASMILPSNICV